MEKGDVHQDEEGVWTEQQTFHGGQGWKFLDNFTEDFSVTTNCIGTPQPALEACLDHLRKTIHHYPAADCEPARSDLTRWLWGRDGGSGYGRVVLGNGASELIDLVIRDAVDSGARRGMITGPHAVQYKEYERAYDCAAGLGKINENVRLNTQDSTTGSVAQDSAPGSVLALVNPNNPTGDYMPVDEIKAYIEDQDLPPNSAVIVDESMQPWVGPQWRADSLVTQCEWIAQMMEKKIFVWVIHSWTKIWSCPGVRIGSVVAPTEEHAKRVMSKQVPWSVNAAAQAFLSAAVKDNEYMEKTWSTTTAWNAEACSMIRERFPEWEIRTKPFLSWIWLDTGSELTAGRAVDIAKEAGMPIRWGKMGYELATCIRVAVRNPDLTRQLLDALKSSLSCASGA